VLSAPLIKVSPEHFSGLARSIADAGRWRYALATDLAGLDLRIAPCWRDQDAKKLDVQPQGRRKTANRGVIRKNLLVLDTVPHRAVQSALKASPRVDRPRVASSNPPARGEILLALAM
jgi:hypothetical protein